MNNGLLRLMLQGSGGTQVYVEKLCCWQVQRFQGAAAAIAWAGAMKLRHISFLPLLRIQDTGAIAKQDTVKEHKKTNL